jgi:hypothetical protein
VLAGHIPAAATQSAMTPKVQTAFSINECWRTAARVRSSSVARSVLLTVHGGGKFVGHYFGGELPHHFGPCIGVIIVFRIAQRRRK